MDRIQLIRALNNYYSPYKEEQAFIPKFIALLSHPDCYQRERLTGHITGSSWIVDEEREFALLTHHKKLNRWLQLGGHADGNENILDVAMKEAKEESGLHRIHAVSEKIFDIDLHAIPEKGDIPAHYHYDIRFLFMASKDENLVISSESKDLKWVALDDLAQKTANNKSILRMALKAKKDVKN